MTLARIWTAVPFPHRVPPSLHRPGSARSGRRPDVHASIKTTKLVGSAGTRRLATTLTPSRASLVRRSSAGMHIRVWWVIIWCLSVSVNVLPNPTSIWRRLSRGRMTWIWTPHQIIPPLYNKIHCTNNTLSCTHQLLTYLPWCRLMQSYRFNLSVVTPLWFVSC